MLCLFAEEGRRLPFRPTSDFLADFKEDMARVRGGGSGYFAGPGFYTEPLKSWARTFGRDRVFIVKTEDLSDHERAGIVMRELCDFLGLTGYDFGSIMRRKLNTTQDRLRLDKESRRVLFEIYRRDISELESFTGRKFDWQP
jgi:hypothetical protein